MKSSSLSDDSAKKPSFKICDQAIAHFFTNIDLVRAISYAGRLRHRMANSDTFLMCDRHDNSMPGY
ncbi:hypothetical protein [Anabaena sp. UHCC 0399]|uniref:hypothetical protein n=1 Tax=Anabaena sp. UHCC 0399 TaxID=3110238 RepID=UPI002B207847|nr:hypothetical protein [Anabaena sp. UHCC 0399]MEA5569389.1 hypothetical protein [Anabaena sp. UHCC 0399]